MNAATLAAPAPNTKTQRLLALVGRLRAKQLELAQRGRTCDSARYAQRAQRVRRALTAVV